MVRNIRDGIWSSKGDQARVMAVPLDLHNGGDEQGRIGDVSWGDDLPEAETPCEWTGR